MRCFALIALGFGLSAVAVGQTSLPPAPTAPLPATQPAIAAAADPLLGKLFRSRTAGIEFNPPVGGATIRDFNSGDIVRFVYADDSWDVRLKPIPLHISVQLSAPPNDGVLELSAQRLKDSNPTAKILRQEVIRVSGRDVGLIEARYNAGTESVFAQQAIFPDFKQTSQQYFSLQMTSRGKPNNAPANQADAEETRASEMFQHMLKSVQTLDRDELAKEQMRRVYKTRGLWLLLDQKAILAAIQPLHFMRVVRDGRDVGVIQVNERPATHNGHDGIEIIIHSNVEVDHGEARVAANPQLPVPDATGIVLPKSIGPTLNPATAPAQATGPQGLYTVSIYFVSFDRDHEDWTTLTQADRNVATQVAEEATSDNVIHHKADPQQRNQILIVPDYNLHVTYEVGDKHGTGVRQATVDRKLTPFYLPQALGQLLPRLLPTDDPGQYMFAFYVGGQRDVMGRYVDVQTPREVELEGQKVQAVPIIDRIGADGFSTTHYVNRNGEWLGSISEDSRLQVFPTDLHTIVGLWSGFKVADEPPSYEDKPANKDGGAHKQQQDDFGFAPDKQPAH